jgi:hypothetical protein
MEGALASAPFFVPRRELSPSFRVKGARKDGASGVYLGRDRRRSKLRLYESLGTQWISGERFGAMKRANTGKKKAKKKSGSKGKKKFNPAVVREELAAIVGDHASKLLTTAIEETSRKPNVPGMKYMFEMAGIYPAGTLPTQEEAEPLAKTLLQALGLPTDPNLQEEVTKDCELETVGAAKDTVE